MDGADTLPSALPLVDMGLKQSLSFCTCLPASAVLRARPEKLRCNRLGLGVTLVCSKLVSHEIRGNANGVAVVGGDSGTLLVNEDSEKKLTPRPEKLRFDGCRLVMGVTLVCSPLHSGRKGASRKSSSGRAEKLTKRDIPVWQRSLRRVASRTG